MQLFIVRHAVSLVLLESCGFIDLAGANDGPVLEASAASTDKCWVFSHLPKAGGTTVNIMLSKMWSDNCSANDEAPWHQGDRQDSFMVYVRVQRVQSVWMSEVLEQGGVEFDTQPKPGN